MIKHTHQQIENYIRDNVVQDKIDNIIHYPPQDSTTFFSTIRLPISLNGIEYTFDKGVIEKNNIIPEVIEGYHKILHSGDYVEAKVTKFGISSIFYNDILSEMNIDDIYEEHIQKHIKSIVKFESDGYYVGNVSKYIYDDYGNEIDEIVYGRSKSYIDNIWLEIEKPRGYAIRIHKGKIMTNKIREGGD